MATSSSGHRHEPDLGYRGMKRVGDSDHAVYYACLDCNTTYVADRCIGRNKDQSHCRRATVPTSNYCYRHRGSMSELDIEPREDPTSDTER